MIVSKPPKKWKMAVLVWMAIYPTITSLYALWGNDFEKITPLPLRTFVTTAIVVPLMVFAIIPLLQKLLWSWLSDS
jgi:antibiotic biosynthesis monooxygenase (ABM) superfamily enzyme